MRAHEPPLPARGRYDGTAMPVKDDDPVTPSAVAGIFHDAREVGRVAQVFTVSVTGDVEPNAIDAATILAVETLEGRNDIDASAGSITVLMSGETAGVVVAQPLGAPALKDLGRDLIQALSARFHGAQIAIGLATTREHKELTMDDAISVAIEGLEVAGASGSNRAVHSELYELTLASRRRQGTVFPLESVRTTDAHDVIPRPTPRPSTRPSRGPEPSEAVEHEAQAPSDAAQANGKADSLGEFDDPFAHLASEAYELNAESARALTNGIAPQAANVAQMEAESKAEIERLRLELDVARREKLAFKGTEAAANIQERRILKLVDQLESAEAEIARLHEEHAADAGVSSAYKTVQGLDPREPKAPAKRVLIDGVFEANRTEDQRKH